MWIVVAIAAATGTWLQASDPTGDRGLNNVMTFGLFLVAALTVGIWWLFFSGLERRLRWGVAALVVGAVVAFFTAFRIESVGGDMLPYFAWRFGVRADRRLEVPPDAVAGSRPDAGPGAADLATTGPWDFPQFLGPRRDLSVTAVTLSRDWETRPPELLWRQPIGAGWSGFAVVNGYAVTQEQRGDLELITCYELETGGLVWSHAIETRFDGVIAGVGPRATPTIDDGIVYALTSNALLVALEGASGRLLWEHDLRAEYGLSRSQEAASYPYGRSSSPLVAGTLVIVPAGGLAGRRLVSLVAYDKKTGERIWEGGSAQISQSSPALATLGGVEQVLIVNESSVSGHDVESGEVLWEHPWRGATNADANVSQAVPLPPDRVFVSKGYGQGAALLRLTARGGGRFAVEELWHDPRVLRTKFTNVTVHDGHVFGLSDGILECVVLETGARVWKHGRYHHGQILRVHDLLLVLAEDGELVLVEASAERRDSVLGRFQALSGKTWNNIALYGPFVVVRNAAEAAVYRLPLTE
jgi:outer membrane protein assembly factor BamB